MKKILYLNCDMGAAGDMLTAALLELVDDRQSFLESLNQLGIPHIVYELEDGKILGSQMNVKVDGEEEMAHDHSIHHHHHNHDHDHGEHVHHHEHHSIQDVRQIINSLNVSEKVKKDSLAVFELIAQAEAKVHHKMPEQVHFHEVGTMDAVADVVAVSYLMNHINPDIIYCSPIHVGKGRVKCAHGILPVPAPATAIILEGIPIYSGRIEGELCTPTGAAILKYFVQKYCEMPPMQIISSGYGIGKKEFDVTNCVTAYLGNIDEGKSATIEISVNLDDMTGEEIGFAQEKLFEAGALDVYTSAIGMKKSRPGVKLSCICKESDEKKMVEQIFKHTSSIGARVIPLKRWIKEKKIVLKETPYGEIHYKQTTYDGKIKEKPEYEEISKIARENDLSIYEVKQALQE